MQIFKDMGATVHNALTSTEHGNYPASTAREIEALAFNVTTLGIVAIALQVFSGAVALSTATLSLTLLLLIRSTSHEAMFTGLGGTAHKAAAEVGTWIGKMFGAEVELSLPNYTPLHCGITWLYITPAMKEACK